MTSRHLRDPKYSNSSSGNIPFDIAHSPALDPVEVGVLVESRNLYRQIPLLKPNHELNRHYQKILYH
jgi:hypothetical protein